MGHCRTLLPSKREVRQGWLHPLSQEHRAYLPNLMLGAGFLPKAMADRAGGQAGCSSLGLKGTGKGQWNPTVCGDRKASANSPGSLPCLFCVDP